MNFTKRREDLIKVYDAVVDDIIEGSYVTLDDVVIDFPGIENLKAGTKMYGSLEQLNNVPHRGYKTKVYVENIDTFEKAKEFGPRCAVLNMASRRHPGGGVANGSRAQEEELCRRSDLLLSLYYFTAQGKMFRFTNQGKEEYPIPMYGGIYSPSVCVYREAKTYYPMKTPFMCNVISVPGINRPELNSKGEMDERDLKLLRAKIRTILRIAAVHGHTKLVLGALGCGAFQNPPVQVAQAFKSVLAEREFKGIFEEICFAILEDQNSKKEHNPEGNLKPFMDIFGGKQ